MVGKKAQLEAVQAAWGLSFFLMNSYEKNEFLKKRKKIHLIANNERMKRKKIVTEKLHILKFLQRTKTKRKKDRL